MDQRNATQPLLHHKDPRLPALSRPGIEAQWWLTWTLPSPQYCGEVGLQLHAAHGNICMLHHMGNDSLCATGQLVGPIAWYRCLTSMIPRLFPLGTDDGRETDLSVSGELSGRMTGAEERWKLDRGA